MGYTNYWNPKKLTHKEIPNDFWDDCIKVLDLIIQKGVKLATGDGLKKFESGKDIINSTVMSDGEYPSIVLNGYSGNDDEDESYETFDLTFNGEWNFCKTARLPYDVAVKCILLLAEEYHLLKKRGEMDDENEGGFDWDGDESDEEYKNAMEIITALKLSKEA